MDAWHLQNFLKVQVNFPILRKRGGTMLYYYPCYFDNFQCTGGMECPDSCCHIWQVTVDKKTLKKYNKVGGDLGRRMHEKIDRKTGRILPHGDDNRCEFLNKDNLCDIILELGEDYLCHTCHTHPRHEEVYYNVRERSLSITCPIACEELLLREEPVTIKVKEDNKKDRHDRYFDAPLFGQLIYMRDNLLSIIQERDIDISVRMTLVLGMAHDIERRIRKRQSRKKNGLLSRFIPSYPEFTQAETDEIKMIVMAYRNPSVYHRMVSHVIDEAYAKKTVVQMPDVSTRQALTDMLFTLCTMEPLKKSWLPYLESIINIRTQMTEEEYKTCQQEFKEEITDIQLEQLLFYFTYLYCCTATYDGMFLAKIKMAVANTILIRELWFMKWLEDEKMLTVRAQAEMAHWFVREVENSDENLEQWDSLMQRNPRFSLKILVKILNDSIMH